MVAFRTSIKISATLADKFSLCSANGGHQSRQFENQSDDSEKFTQKALQSLKRASL